MPSKLYSTLNNLSEATRLDVIALLNQQLADAFDLYSQVKQAHWNVKGMQFISLHELFDGVADEVLGFVDQLAERITALGGVANGTLRMASHTTSLPEFPLEIHGGEAFVKAIAERVANFSNSSRKGIDTASGLGDQATADLFTEVVREMDKQLYFLEAHLN